MLTPVLSSAFKRDVKRMQKQGKDMCKLREVVELLLSGEPLPPQYADHPLKGNRQGFRDCHIESNWLLLYVIVGEELRLSNTGSHDDVF
jgi:mRNA interferase YafQ